MFGGAEVRNIPGAGDAAGEVKKAWVERAMGEVNLARAWGLVPSSYEGGWAVGGDRARTAFMNHCNFASPLASKAEQRAMDTWTSVGGYEFQRHYQQIPGEYRPLQIEHFWNALDYPLPQGAIAYNKRLPVLPDRNGVRIPGTLTPADAILAGTPLRSTTRNTSGEIPAYGWIAWNILVPESAEYTVRVAARGDGILRAFLNESRLLTQGPAEELPRGQTRFTPGMHTIKIRAMDASAIVERVVVANGVRPRK
jgi:hypothetical protein